MASFFKGDGGGFKVPWTTNDEIFFKGGGGGWEASVPLTPNDCGIFSKVWGWSESATDHR